MKLSKSQLQFFFDEVLEKFGWCEEIEETTVDPLDYVLDEINNMKRHTVNVEKQNEEIRLILLDQSRVIEQFQKLLGVATATSAFAKVAVLMREDKAESLSFEFIQKVRDGEHHHPEHDDEPCRCNEIAAAEFLKNWSGV